MAQRHQRGWLRKEMRSQAETWVLFICTTRKSASPLGGHSESPPPSSKLRGTLELLSILI
jgi:hypothetical protein